MIHVQVVDFQSPKAPSLFTRSLIETGFAVLSHHPIRQKCVERVHRNWLDFFASDDKHFYAYDPEKQDGFFSCEVSETAKGHSIKDLKEFYHVYPWGRIPDWLRDETLAYYREAQSVACTLLSWIEEHTPKYIMEHLGVSFSEMIEGSQQTLLRVLHYPPLSGEEPAGSVRAAAHQDINLITILPASNQSGLEVQDRDGVWHPVPCDFGTLAVNVGDMLEEITRSHYVSTPHRVINPCDSLALRQSRLSLPLFLHPRPEVVLSERHTAASYLHERLVQLGIRPQINPKTCLNA